MISRASAELGMAGLTALFGAVTMVGASEYGVGWSPSGPEPGAFPFYIGLLILLASLVNAALAFYRRGPGDIISHEQFRRVMSFSLPILGLVIVSLVLGLYVGMALYMFGTLVFQNRYSPLRAAIIALLMPVCTYLLIEKAFRVAMLKGPLEAALGL